MKLTRTTRRLLLLSSWAAGFGVGVLLWQGIKVVMRALIGG
ncbi:MAG: hypothetical protein OXQ94_13870 [Gemmatimonadota bacterium]|nr:hypothetical protein [Gemmatimonadota bacterium]MDE2872763.1 hypothetical protein [Gemmatimonadota bacterium]